MHMVRSINPEPSTIAGEFLCVTISVLRSFDFWFSFLLLLDYSIVCYYLFLFLSSLLEL